MANPQKENGFTPIANEIMEALSRARLTGGEFRFLMHIFRNTYGYGRKEYTASLAKIGQAIGMNRVSVKKVSSKLLAHRLIAVSPQGNRRPVKYRINKDYETWCYPTGQQLTVTPQANKTVTPQGNSEKGLPLDKKKKERKPPYIPPRGEELKTFHPWLDSEIWDKWVAFRKEIKKPLTEIAVKEQINFLSENQENHIEIIKTSIRSSWQGLFPLKAKAQARGKTAYEKKQDALAEQAKILKAIREREKQENESTHTNNLKRIF